MGTFLDIEGAFDNVSFQAIQTSLNNTHMHTSVANWILNMVTNRYVTLSHGGVTKRLRVTRGSPHGSIVSVLMETCSRQSPKVLCGGDPGIPTGLRRRPCGSMRGK